MDIDIRGVKSIAALIPLNAVFLLPPSWKVLESRLRSRGTEEEKNIKKRLAHGREEVEEALGDSSHLFSFLVNYDYHLSAYGLKYFVHERYSRNLGLL